MEELLVENATHRAAHRARCHDDNADGFGTRAGDTHRADAQRRRRLCG
jgi:hypothetical protein